MNFPSTHSTLLSRLRNRDDQAAWREFEARYRPLIVEFCRRRGLTAADAEDVTQRVMSSMVQTLPGFLYDPARGRFRSYLLRCTKNAITDWLRCPSRRDLRLDTSVAEGLAGGGDIPSPDEEALWEREWVAHHYRRALETIRQTFAAKSVEIFERMIAGSSPSDLAIEYNMTDDAIVKIRQRVRQRMEELIAQQVREEEELS